MLLPFISTPLPFDGFLSVNSNNLGLKECWRRLEDDAA